MIENPKTLPHELNYAGRCVNSRYFKFRGPPDGYDLMARDWDTAIILDACRHDVFAEESTLDGDLSKEIAPGSNSRRFIQETFKGRSFHDTVYVSGNPFTPILDDDTFYDVKLDETWSDRSSEAPPEQITDAAIDVHEEYPNKRVIVHYMTPHRPYISNEFQYIEDRIECLRGLGGAVLRSATWDEVRAAYRANLRLVLEHVEELLEYVQGKVVVTADHGEMLGERARPIPVRVYGHPRYCYIPELVEVPWFEIENGERREVREEPPVGSVDVDEEARKERLQALGYLEEA